MLLTPIEPSIDDFISEKIIEQINDKENKLWCYVCRGGTNVRIPNCPSGICAFLTEGDAIQHCKFEGNVLVRTEQKTINWLSNMAKLRRLSSILVLTPTNELIEVINVT